MLEAPRSETYSKQTRSRSGGSLDSIYTSQADRMSQSPGKMPMVVGMRTDVAEATIELAIPNPEIVIEPGGSHTPPDTVTAQRPVPGTVLEPGSRVTLTVSVRP